MDHRLFAVLVIVGFALQGAGCASESQRARREEILMPIQTGSTFQRRVVIDTGVAKKSTKKKKKEKEKDKEKESKRNSPKSPAPTPEPSPPKPEDESTAPPDRFR
jgi:hypothetical protein